MVGVINLKVSRKTFQVQEGETQRMKGNSYRASAKHLFLLAAGYLNGN